MDLSKQTRYGRLLTNEGASSNHIDEYSLNKQQKELEQKINFYKGDDPLEPRYNYIKWIECNFENTETNPGYLKMLEDTLRIFNDEDRYKQDNRYVELLIKYIESQPNEASNMYKCAYDIGHGTTCAIFYHAWATHCEKEQNYQLANEVYQLGLKHKAEPFDDFKEIIRHFQLNFGRRVLGCASEPPTTPYRKALKNLSVNSQPTQLNELKDPKIATNIGEHHKHISTVPSDKENLSSCQKQSNQIPGFIIKGNIKVGEPVDFKCPVAYFEPNDPTKIRMYPKDKIYPTEDQEFQMEELMAREYETRVKPRIFATSESCASDNWKGTNNKTKDGTSGKVPVAYFEPDNPLKVPMYPKNKVYHIERKEYVKELEVFAAFGHEFQLEELMAMRYEERSNSLANKNCSIDTQNISSTEKPETPNYSSNDKHDSNTFCNQSVGTHPSELSIVRNMFKFPSPVPVKTQNNCKPSTENSDEKFFKAPQPHKPTFTLYKDDSLIANKDSKCDFKKSQLLEHLSSKNKQKSLYVNVDNDFEDENNDFLVRRPVETDKENFSRNCKPRSDKKVPLKIHHDDDGDGFESNAVIKNIGLLKTVTPYKTEVPESCSKQKESNRKLPFVIQCDDSIVDCENKPPVTPKNITDENTPLVKNCEAKYEPLDLPYVPPPFTNNPIAEDEIKENKIPKGFNFQLPERRALSGVLQPSQDIPIETVESEDKDYDFGSDTINTKHFMGLPSSTPYMNLNKHKNYKQNIMDNSENTVTYCYNVQEQMVAHAAQTTGTRLMTILEASKERYSSSSGSSTNGLTPYGPNHLKTVNTCSEIKEESQSVCDLEKSLSFLNLGTDIDPFCPELISKLLAHIKFIQMNNSGLFIVNRDITTLKVKSKIPLGNKTYYIEKLLGEGAYGKVMKAADKEDIIALKYEKPPSIWEFYIASEIHKRSSTLLMKNGFIDISEAYIFNNASILKTEWAKYGNLIDMMNKLKKGSDKSLTRDVSVLFCVQMFQIVEQLHKCKIIHGDLKPDNFVLCKLPTTDPTDIFIKLIDFGRSIDMSLFPEGTKFNTVVTTDSFQCAEMKDGRSWTYQIDYYGLAGTCYCMLTGNYMKIHKVGGRWTTNPKLARYFYKEVWEPIFDELLNVESCSSLPDLTKMRNSLEKLYATNNMKVVQRHITSLINCIEGH